MNATIPRLSIVIPVYNDLENLARCLQSLEQSSFRDFEVIVVDDGSRETVEFKTRINGSDSCAWKPTGDRLKRGITVRNRRGLKSFCFWMPTSASKRTPWGS